MKRAIAISCLLGIVQAILSPSLANATTGNTALAPIGDIHILRDGITAANAGKVMFEKTYTQNDLNLSWLTFTVVPGAKVWLDSKIRENFTMNRTVREKYAIRKQAAGFTAKAKFTDTIVEYPDRVRITMQTEYSYNSKAEHDAVFGPSATSTGEEAPTAAAVNQFLQRYPEYQKYANGIAKASKKDIIDRITEKALAYCIANKFNTCKRESIRTNVTNEVQKYRGKRTVTERIDVNKIPLAYDLEADSLGKNKIDIKQRIAESNLPKEPSEVRLSAAQIARSFEYLNVLQSDNASLQTLQATSQTARKKNCEWLSGMALNECITERDLLQANADGSNAPKTLSGTLLNGFTLGKSYSYNASDSASVLGFEVYNVGLTYYVGYGVGIRIPIDVSVTTDKNRLESRVSDSYQVRISVDTVNKDAAWFSQAIGASKAFNGKEAVLEAGAYARWYVYLFEEKVFDLDIGGKSDWGKDLKMPFNGERLKIFEGIAYGESLWLKVVLYGITITGDIMAEGYLDGKIRYECRTLESQGGGNASDCRDMKKTTLKSADVPDIYATSSEAKTFQFVSKPEKYYYQNSLGVFQPYGTSFQNFGYVPQLDIHLSFRAKAGIDTGDYFWFVWLAKTDWMEVYSFELDLPAFRSHEGYGLKRFDNYLENKNYAFSRSTQDTNTETDTSVSCPNYTVTEGRRYFLEKDKTPVADPQKSDYRIEDFYDYGYGWKVFYLGNGSVLHQTNKRMFHSSSEQSYHTLIQSARPSENLSDFQFDRYGYTRRTINTAQADYQMDKVSELQFLDGSTAYYYSEATNTLFSGEVETPMPYAQPMPKIRQDKTFAKLSSGEKPAKSAFADWDEDTITQLSPSYPFQKFQFAFPTDFATSRTFSYIAKASNGEYSIQTYRNGKWASEIGPDEVYTQISGTPIYLQYFPQKNGTKNDLFVISAEKEAHGQETKYSIAEYRYQDEANPLVYVFPSGPIKSFVFPVEKKVSWFAYDAHEKTLYVSYVERANNVLSSKVSAIRFNGSNNEPLERILYFQSHTKASWKALYGLTEDLWSNEVMNDYDFKSIPDDRRAASLIYSVQFGKTTDSLIIGSINSWMYEGLPNRFRHFHVKDVAEISLARSNTQTPTSGACGTDDPPPAPSVMNVSPPTQTTDPYVAEKLQEIQRCFEGSYAQHLKNIDTALETNRAKKTVEKDTVLKEKYSRAITRLEQIRAAFVRRYESLFSEEK